MSSANEENPWVEMVEGVKRRTTVSGRAMSQMVVDTFSPPREDLLAQDREARGQAG